MTDPRSGTRFGVYLCPPAGDPYYELGGQLLGFDVRVGREVPLPAFLRPEWQADAGPYGLHLTVVEGFYTDPAWWPEVEAEVRACVACLTPGAVLTLTGGRVEAWDDGETWVHRLDANDTLLVLHTLLLARLARFVTASPFDAQVAAGKYARPFEQARMRLLHTPRGLDSWQPHFTLVQPYGGPDPAGLRARLEALTASHHAQTYRSVALFEKREGEAHWRVRADPPLGTPQTA
ncbi:hypothetical protein E5F05_07035 [Deinococcus metallilatus]|uniref:2'-5' RNA ligase family protein n=1 Tax=Deinococcus metallilatus TaxID=1211322 RepID=A0AAJ5K0X0_9DEIO|nr:hypothetical protein [Deinococcus metallilatus]MBB5294702.1 hypothetical protein [Deinococcus metallilatus]QBY07732.1 hypothetical protein E5F05_07035 [Deinococcus metallilatus]RXJ14148.1 hypothetical protein ERJ73_05870 [Deinococcus metallilatus]TLK30113.1 hypothetical protein FCS05_06185 [Deinococcus metallilatus]GMA15919.1 hypothetical protein GCM10025871_22500 [Deinococcus metallilatus]